MTNCNNLNFKFNTKINKREKFKLTRSFDSSCTSIVLKAPSKGARQYFLLVCVKVVGRIASQITLDSNDFPRLLSPLKTSKNLNRLVLYNKNITNKTTVKFLGVFAQCYG